MKSIDNHMIMRYTFFVIVFILIPVISKAKTIEVEGEYEYRFPISVSIEEGRKEALRRAQINALERVFGRNIGESSLITKSNINQQSNSYYSKESYSELKGEWIETIGEPQFSNPEIDGESIIIYCYVKGKARYLDSSQIDFEFKTLRHVPDVKYEATEFLSGDDFFIYFRSPESGFINIFLLDLKEEEAYCLLPYKNSKEGVYEVKADKDYFLFSPKLASDKERPFVEEYVLTTNKKEEHNEIYVIFSPEKFGKASLDKHEKELSVPRNTSIKKFNEWLAKSKSRDNNISTQKN